MRIHSTDRSQRPPNDEEEINNNLSDNSLTGLGMPRQQSSRNSSTNMLHPILHSPLGSDEGGMGEQAGAHGDVNELQG